MLIADISTDRWLIVTIDYYDDRVEDLAAATSAEERQNGGDL